MVLDPFQSRAHNSTGEEPGIWRSAASDRRSEGDFFEKLLLKFEGMRLPDEKRLPHLHRKPKNNRTFNRNLSIKLKEIESNKAGKRESLRQIFLSTDPLIRTAWRNAMRSHGQPVKKDILIGEKECVQTIARFLDKISRFEKAPNPQNLKEMGASAFELVVILEMSTQDIFKRQRNKLESEHLYKLASSFQNLKPLFACAYSNTPEFSAVFSELMQLKRGKITNHLRRAACALLNVLIDAKDRHESLVLKAE